MKTMSTSKHKEIQMSDHLWKTFRLRKTAQLLFLLIPTVLIGIEISSGGRISQLEDLP